MTQTIRIRPSSEATQRQVPLEQIWWCYLKGVLLHSGDDLFEEDLSGQGVTVIDHWLHICSVPAVDLQAAAAFPQSTVHTHTLVMQ